MHGRTDGPANLHIHILLNNLDYYLIIGLLRLPQNKVRLPNESELGIYNCCTVPSFGLIPCGSFKPVSGVWSHSTLVNC